MMNKKNSWLNSLVSKLMKTSVASMLIATLAGCLISPYHGQKFSSRSEEIPFTVYTADKAKPITIECAKANTDGSAHGNYQLVETFWPSTQGILDSIGNRMYSASIDKPLPYDCYRYHNYADAYDYITVVRVRQSGSNQAMYTFDSAGLACVGEWVGKGRNWLHWVHKGCHKVNSDTGEPVGTVFLKAKH